MENSPINPVKQIPARYTVISPVRDEAEYLENTILSMVNQTVRPVEWVLVNDGSRDGTEEIIRKYAAEHPWIKLVNRQDRGVRQRGKGVVEAFYEGFNIAQEDTDFVCKLDGDITFAPDYFELLLQEFAADPKLGIAGGGLYEKPDGKNWVLYTTRDHVRGCIKMYRKACFEAIGGLSPSMGWDGIDEWKAMAYGWKVYSFLEYPVYHYRFTGAATGFYKSFVEQGYGAYRMGYHPLYILARSIRRMTDRPVILGGIGMFYGYLSAWIKREEFLAEPAVVQFIRKTQFQKLLGRFAGKSIHTIS